MNRFRFYLVLMVGLAAFLLCNEAFAADVATSTGFNTAGLEAETTKIKDFIFGPPLRIAGLMGGAWGIISSVISSSLRPLIIYGGIGLAANLVPKFADMLF